MTDITNIPLNKLNFDLTRFDGFEIAPVVKVDELPDGSPVYEQVNNADMDCDFWTLYGHYDPTDFNNGVPFAKVGIDALLDLPTCGQAEQAQKYFEAFRTLQLDAKGACERFNEICDDDDITCVTHVIDGMMEHMNALEENVTP
jgi:hypothetical protein